MKISARLMLLVGLMSALLVLVGGVGLWGTASSNAALKTVYEDRTVALAQLGDVRGRLITNAFVLVSVTSNAFTSGAYTGYFLFSVNVTPNWRLKCSKHPSKTFSSGK